MPPSHPAGCAILWVALLPAPRRVKTAGNVSLRDCAKAKAQHLAEVQHDQAVAVRGLPVTAPAHPGYADSARDEFLLRQHEAKLEMIKYQADNPPNTARNATATEIMIAVLVIRSAPAP